MEDADGVSEKHVLRHFCSFVSLEGLVAGLVIICVWIAPIFLMLVDTINFQTQYPQDLTPKSTGLLMIDLPVAKEEQEADVDGYAAELHLPPPRRVGRRRRRRRRPRPRQPLPPPQRRRTQRKGAAADPRSSPGIAVGDGLLAAAAATTAAAAPVVADSGLNVGVVNWKKKQQQNTTHSLQKHEKPFKLRRKSS